jgi:hypothetical protein
MRQTVLFWTAVSNTGQAWRLKSPYGNFYRGMRKLGRNSRQRLYKPALQKAGGTPVEHKSTMTHIKNALDLKGLFMCRM